MEPQDAPRVRVCAIARLWASLRSGRLLDYGKAVRRLPRAVAF
jgi:hypothetical protein